MRSTAASRNGLAVALGIALVCQAQTQPQPQRVDAPPSYEAPAAQPQVPSARAATPGTNETGAFGEVLVNGDAAFPTAGVVLRATSRPTVVAHTGGTTADSGFVVFNSGNTELLRVTSVGRVGIGSSNPGSALTIGSGTTHSDVAVGTNTGNALHIGTYFNNAAFAMNRRVRDGVFTNPNLPTASIVLYTASGNSSIVFNTSSTNGVIDTERMRINSIGDVGIGGGPAAKLHVYGGPVATRIDGNNSFGVSFYDISVRYPWSNGVLMDMLGNSVIEVSDLQIGSLGLPVMRSKTGNLVLSAPANRDVIIGEAGAATKLVFAATGTSSFGGGMTVNGDVVVGSAGQSTKLIVAGGGTSAFSGPVTINGGLQVTGDITGTRVLNAVYRDVAEWVDSDQKLGDGTVVIVAPDKADQVVASSGSYDSRVAGVVSAQPGVLLGIPGEAKVKVATTGRVKVKVDASVHPIALGDLLVSSTKAGVAMKSIPLDLGGVAIHRPGTIIGKALEPLAGGEGEVLVLLSLQ